MGHAVQAQPELAGGVAADHPQSVVGVGHPKARRTPREVDGRPQQQPARCRDIALAGLEEPGAEHHLDVVLLGGQHHRDRVVHVVLAVGVEGHHVVDVEPVQGVADAGLQRGTLSEVRRVAYDVGAGGAASAAHSSALPSSTHTTC